MCSPHPLRRRHQAANKTSDQPTPHSANILRHEPNRRAHLARNADRQLRILIRLLLGPAREHKLVIDVRALHAIQHVQQKHAGAQRRILEAADRAVAPAALRHVVRPADHVGVGDLALAEALRERRQRGHNVLAHELPDHPQRERALAVGDVRALDPHQRKRVLLPQLDGVVCVLDRLEPHHLAAGCWRLVGVPPVDAAGDHLVVGL